MLPTPYKVLLLGASYGSLLAIKLVAAGHTAKLVCLPAEAEAFNSDGARVRMPIKGREGLVEVHSKNLPGKLSADGPGPEGVGRSTVLRHVEARDHRLAVGLDDPLGTGVGHVEPRELHGLALGHRE